MQSSFYKLHPRLGSDNQSAFRNAMWMDIGLASSFRQSEMRRDGTHAMVMTLPSQANFTVVPLSPLAHPFPPQSSVCDR